MLGRIEKIKLRDVWKNEARDFTKWLFDNIDVLGEELDISLTPIAIEENVGIFSADITAEDSSGNNVLIENQLEKTDHDHLGKILTYVSNLEAKTAIWISSEPRPEHIKAINWLNESVPDVNFYLVKIELYRIGDSDPAPKFSIVAGPNETTGIVRDTREVQAERHKKRFEFWKLLLEKSKAKTRLFANISPSTETWISAGAGKSGLSYNYGITYKSARIELYIDRGKDSYEENKKIFDQFFAHKDEIEEAFGGKLEWLRLDNARASKVIKVYSYAGLNDKDKWDKLQDEMINDMIKLEKAFGKYIETLKI